MIFGFEQNIIGQEEKVCTGIDRLWVVQNLIQIDQPPIIIEKGRFRKGTFPESTLVNCHSK